MGIVLYYWENNIFFSIKQNNSHKMGKSFALNPQYLICPDCQLLYPCSAYTLNIIHQTNDVLKLCISFLL